MRGKFYKKHIIQYSYITEVYKYGSNALQCTVVQYSTVLLLQSTLRSGAGGYSKSGDTSLRWVAGYGQPLCPPRPRTWHGGSPAPAITTPATDSTLSALYNLWETQTHPHRHCDTNFYKERICLFIPQCGFLSWITQYELYLLLNCLTYYLE